MSSNLRIVHTNNIYVIESTILLYIYTNIDLTSI
jgi:hypothetical protein